MRRLRLPLPLVMLLLSAAALSHPQILFATITTEPPTPPAGEPFIVDIMLTDSSGQGMSDLAMELRVFDSDVDLEAIGNSEGEGEPPQPDSTVPLAQTETEGNYRGEVAGLPAGSYPVRIVELVGNQVESNAVTRLPVGADPVDIEVILPPVAAGLGSWLVWLVGLPLLAGVLVTILVLTNRGRPESE